MAISPESDPNIALDYAMRFMPVAAEPVSESGNLPALIDAPSAWHDRSDNNPNSFLPYTFGVIALVVVGYLGYAAFRPSDSVDMATSQGAAVSATAAALPPTAP